MKPTIGRIVHYKTRGSADGAYPPTNFAAMITKVYSDNCVSLVTFGESGFRFEMSVQRGDQPGQWHWPEFVPAMTLQPNVVPLPYIPPQPFPMPGLGDAPSYPTPVPYAGPHTSYPQGLLSGGNTASQTA